MKVLTVILETALVVLSLAILAFPDARMASLHMLKTCLTLLVIAAFLNALRHAGDASPPPMEETPRRRLRIKFLTALALVLSVLATVVPALG